MPYEFEQTSDGLIIRDVEIMTTLKAGERSELKRDIDKKWLKDTIKLFEKRRDKEGKRPFLLRRHNTKDNPAEVIGRLDNLRLRDGWIISDILVTHPEAIEKLKRGEMPTRSAEFSPGRNLLWGLSLIEGHEGHFDSKLPELVLEELVQLGAEEDRTHSTLDRPIDLKEEKHMPLTNEDLAQLRTFIHEELVALVNEGAALEPAAAVAPDADLDPDAIEDDVAQAVSGIKADADEQVAKLTRKSEIDTYVVALKADDVIFTEKQLRTMFEAKETSEGREEMFKRLKGMTKEDVKLEIETEYTEKTVSVKLREEYAANEEDWKTKGVSEEDYVRLNEGSASDLA